MEKMKTEAAEHNNISHKLFEILINSQHLQKNDCFYFIVLLCSIALQTKTM